MRIPLFAAALAALALVRPAAAAPAAPVPEAKFGLAPGGPMEVRPPPVVKENESAPGERPAFARPFPGAAPAIPHGVGDFLPITLSANQCVDCHAVAKEGHDGKQGKQKKRDRDDPTPIPASHYVDLRNAPGKPGDKVAGARWNCTACHVPQQDVKPLVKSPYPR